MSKGKNKKHTEQVGDVLGPIEILGAPPAVIEVPAVVPEELTPYQKIEAKEQALLFEIETHTTAIKDAKKKIKALHKVRAELQALDVTLGFAPTA